MRIVENQHGFTLVEVMLYIAIVAVIVLASSVLLQTMVEARIRHQVMTEVNEQGLAAMAMMTQAIRNAEVITSPLSGASAASAIIDVVTASNDPTIFDLSGGVLRSKEGAGDNISLTSSRVTVSALSFTNLTTVSSPGSLRITFTITHINPSSDGTYDYARTFTGTASLRQP